MAFHALKSAGVVPVWMEMGREVEGELAEIEEMRDRTARFLRGRLASGRPRTGASEGAAATTGQDEEGEPSRARWPFGRRRSARRQAAQAVSRSSATELEAERRRARQRYVDRAAALDAKIGAYNAALPDDLWRLRRGRMTANDAGRDFDAACPPITSGSGDGF